MEGRIGRRRMLAGGLALAGGTVALAGGAGKLGAWAAVSDGADAGGELARQVLGRLKVAEPPSPLAEAVLVDAEGARHGLGSFAGRGLVVNLWATWCAPCVAELPALAVLAGRVRDQGIMVLAAASDRGGAETVTRFYARHGISGLAVWLDPQGAAARTWGARGLPTTLLVDRAGRERGRLEGAADWGNEGVVAEVRQMVG
ncbi:MAG: TlpA disulfide reductase family protein [Thermomicrobiales bacterium]